MTAIPPNRHDTAAAAAGNERGGVATGSGLDASQLAMVRAVAYGRIGLGLAFALTPRRALALWPGPIAGRSGPAGPLEVLLARSVAVRDLALGLGTLMAVKHSSPLRGWLEAGAVADGGDALAVMGGFGHMGRLRAGSMLVAAAGTAALGRKLAAASSQPAVR
ncbi:MAG: hypothetical protein ACT4OS_06995 [Acidimicrobiales bacterium]